MIVNKYANGNGGGGTGSTITVDTALSSSSTNPVENRVIYEALYGESASTQMEIIESATTGVYLTFGADSYYFKETNIPGYLAINLGDYINSDGYLQLYDSGWKYFDQASYSGNNTITTEKLGVKCILVTAGMSSLYINSSNLDGTYNYYMVYNQVGGYVVVYKTLPVITEVSDHAANISDLPVAQDGSDTNYYVYSGEGDKRVISQLSMGTISSNTETDRKYAMSLAGKDWVGNALSIPYAYFAPGSEEIGGIKTPRDSKVIDNAIEALSGLTETKTLVSASTTNDCYIRNLFGQNINLYETDDPRYLVIPASAASQYNVYGYVYIHIYGTDYYFLNGDNVLFVANGDVYQLGDYRTDGKRVGPTSPDTSIFFQNYTRIADKYFIIDAELKLVIISDSLTITRTKSIQQMIDNIPQPDMSDYVSKDELTGGTIETPVVLGNLDSGWFGVLYDRNNWETFNYYFKTTNIDNLVGINLGDYFNTTSNPSGIAISQVIGGGTTWTCPNGDSVMSVDTHYQMVQGSSGGLENIYPSTLDGTYNYYLFFDVDTKQIWISKDAVIEEDVPGILDNYWTTGETQNAIQEAIEGAVITGATVTVDDHLDTASTNPVENRVIATKFSDYYTKAETDAEITAATQNFVTSGDVTTAITSATQNFITSGDVTTIVDAAVATAITVDNALSSSSTNPVQNQVITNALANFVQSTSVRTIVSCTQSQYDTMGTHDPNTFYIITGVNS